MFRIIVAVTAVAALGGCQTVQHNTASGKPEVTISAPSADVKSAFVGTMTNYGYSLARDSQFQIVMQKESTNVMANVLMGSRYDPTVDARVSATFLDMGGQTRVTTELGIVRNGGSAFEAITPMNNSPDSAGVQNLLSEIKSGLEGGKSVGQVVSEASQRDIAKRALAMQPAKTS